jgi:hypothetical protein
VTNPVVVGCSNKLFVTLKFKLSYVIHSSFSSTKSCDDHENDNDDDGDDYYNDSNDDDSGDNGDDDVYLD